MFRKMRRSVKELSKVEAVELFETLSYGTLALLGDIGYPYSLPISFVYSDNKIYFHGSKEGQKYEAIEKNDKISLSVVEKDEVQPEKFTTYFKSAIAFGKVRRLTEESEIQKAMELLLLKYSPEYMESGRKYISAAWNNFCAYEIAIDHLSAKGVE